MADHTSGRNLNRPGWVFVTYQNREGSSHYPYYNELVAVKLDGTRTERITHLYAYDFDYVAESHGVPSPDGLKVMWASDWENNDFPVQAYVADYSDKVIVETIGKQEFNNKVSCYPNPFSSFIHFDFELSEQGEVDISLFDITGKKIACLMNGYYEKGNFSLDWYPQDDAIALKKGVYIVKFTGTNTSYQTKIVMN